MTDEVQFSLGQLLESPILRHFSYQHLPPHLAAISKQFAETAFFIVQIPNGPEREVALRKLLEAKDAAVRAKIEAGF